MKGHMKFVQLTSFSDMDSPFAPTKLGPESKPLPTFFKGEETIVGVKSLTTEDLNPFSKSIKIG